MEIDTQYRPDSVEERWYSEWVARGLFLAQPDSPRLPFCMVIPPPNVTGSRRAPAAVVERERVFERELQEKKARIERTLAALGNGGPSG